MTKCDGRLLDYPSYIIIIHDILYVARLRLLIEAWCHSIPQRFTHYENHDNFPTETNTGNKSLRFGVHGDKRGAWSKKKEHGVFWRFELLFLMTRCQGNLIVRGHLGAGDWKWDFLYPGRYAMMSDLDCEIHAVHLTRNQHEMEKMHACRLWRVRDAAVRWELVKSLRVFCYAAL